jgi:crotonobetainyl-CoA:carnitine CoA-transferase CaiB-like acyl-CoA transferase
MAFTAVQKTAGAIGILGGRGRKGSKRLWKPGMGDEARFSTFSGRLKNREVLDSQIQEWTKKYSTGEVMAVLQKEECRPSSGCGDLANDPQLRARGFFFELDHHLGKIVADTSPIRLSCHRQNTCGSPAPGQDNDYVLIRLQVFSR